MATEAKAVINGGFAFLDEGRVLHVADKEHAEKDAVGKVVKFSGQHAQGYPLIPAGQEYQQLVIIVHEYGSLKEKFNQSIPAHVRAVTEQLK